MNSSSIIEQLRRACGDDAVSTAEDTLAYYGHDALGAQRGFIAPAERPRIAVVSPANAEQVAAVLRIANEARIAVTPYGGGTGLMGGATPIAGGIVLRTARMRRIRTIDAIDASVVAEAGCVLSDVNDALAPHCLMLGHDPWTVGIATVGGAISTDGLGFLGGQHGRAGAQALGLEVVLAGGTIVRTQDAPAHAAGLDLKSLLIGSEGTLGVITAAHLQAFPIPEERALRGWRFPSFEAGYAAVLDLRDAGIAPTVLDYGERPDGDTEDGEPATLFVGFDGAREVVAAQLARSATACAAAGGRDVEQVETDAFWNERHDVADRFAEARRSRRPWRSADGTRSFDYVHVALPASAVLAYYALARDIAREHSVAIIEAGVWVSPRLFSLTLSCAGVTHDDAVARMSSAVAALLHAAHDAGGSIEYCHGIGVRLADLAPLEYGAGLDALRAIKRALDPHRILNPGKLGLD